MKKLICEERPYTQDERDMIAYRLKFIRKAISRGKVVQFERVHQIFTDTTVRKIVSKIELDENTASDLIAEGNQRVALWNPHYTLTEIEPKKLIWHHYYKN